MSRADRDAALERLATRSFDLLVVGAGITGAGIAAAAARLGLSVALIDGGDFGGATSSASTKLVHGGLRYLRLGDLRLVRAAQLERLVLRRTVAPHLVRPQPFLLPLYEDGPYSPLVLGAGLLAYAALAGLRGGGARLVAPARGKERVPPLRVERLRSCGLYLDAQTHDSRLCLANVRAAAEAGATVLNYAEAIGLRILDGRVAGAEVRDRIGDRTLEASARAVVNATGPWVDAVRRLEDARAGASVTLSKGVHAVLPLELPWSAALITPVDEVRVSIAVPWEGTLVVGTTDAPWEGDPGSVEPTEPELAQVLAEACLSLDPSVARREDVLFSFAGLRVIPGIRSSTARSRREELLLRGRRGMLSVAGGKLTTYRLLALRVLEELAADLDLHRLDARAAPLPGAVEPATAVPALRRSWPQLAPGLAAHLVHLYGSEARRVLEPTSREPSLLSPIHPGGPDVLAQALYAREHEWACTPGDVLRRRTTVAMRGGATPRAVALVERILETGA